jgi:hypothetical protein
MRSERRGPWYLLTGLVVGILLGLAYGWLLAPVSYTNTPPVSLRADYKDQYRTLIALAYAANGDLGRARARLALLGDEQPGEIVANQALRAAAENRPVSEVQSLAVLAEALGSPVEVVAPTPSPQPSATATQTASPTPSPQPSSTSEPITDQPTTGSAPTDTGVTQPQPTSTLATGSAPANTPPVQPTATSTRAAPFVLRVREQVCDPNLPGPLIQVLVFDSFRQPVPGVAVNINWPGGQERFFTGLKPEISPGYADFLMDPLGEYTVRLGDGGQTVSELRSQPCSDTGETYPGSLRLEFQQP